MSTFFAVELEDRPGALGELATLLSDAGVNIEAFSADANGVTILTDNTETATNTLQEKGLTFDAHEVIEIELPNRPGELARIATRLGSEGVNIATTFGSSTAKTNHGRIYINVEDVDAAWTALDGYQ